MQPALYRELQRFHPDGTMSRPGAGKSLEVTLWSEDSVFEVPSGSDLSHLVWSGLHWGPWRCLVQRKDVPENSGPTPSSRGF